MPTTARRFRRLALVAAFAAACARGDSAPSAPRIGLDTTNPGHAIVEVKGLSRRDLSALSRLNLSEDEWAAVLRVTVSGQAATPLPAVAGRYAVDGAVRFTPSYPLDPGRDYEVTFDPSRLSRSGAPQIAAVRAVLALPAVVRTPTTVVDAVYPSGDLIPANQLRMYVQFSAPMGQLGGLGHIVLLDAAAAEINDALLPLDTELWSADRTRYTVLFDPGRVKREILPNRQMGRPPRPGETITFVVKADWIDAQGMVLKSEFRREYRVGPPDEAPLSTAAWRIAPRVRGMASRSRFPNRWTTPCSSARSASPAPAARWPATWASAAARRAGRSCPATHGRPAPTPSSCCRFSRIWREIASAAPSRSAHRATPFRPRTCARRRCRSGYSRPRRGR